MTRTKFLRSSPLGVEGTRTDRLIAITRHVGANHYISGPSAKDYIEPEKFEVAGITLEYMKYDYPEYPQLYPPYDPFVSILDLTFHDRARCSAVRWQRLEQSWSLARFECGRGRSRASDNQQARSAADSSLGRCLRRLAIPLAFRHLRPQRLRAHARQPGFELGLVQSTGRERRGVRSAGSHHPEHHGRACHAVHSIPSSTCWCGCTTLEPVCRLCRKPDSDCFLRVPRNVPVVG